MNGSDARIVRLFTARSGGLVEDDTPNASSPRATQFDLILQAEAGGILGDSGANYTLTIIAVDDDAVRPEARLEPTGVRSTRSGASITGGGRAGTTS